MLHGLTDALNGLEHLVTQLLEPEWRKAVSEVIGRLSQAVYADTGDQSLKRYLSDHLRQLAALDVQLVAGGIAHGHYSREGLQAIIATIKIDFRSYLICLCRLHQFILSAGNPVSCCAGKEPGKSW